MSIIDLNLNFLSSILTDTQKELIYSELQAFDDIESSAIQSYFEIPLPSLKTSNIFIDRIDQTTLSPIEQSSVATVAKNIIDQSDSNFFTSFPLRSSLKSDSVFDDLNIEARDLLFFGGSAFLSYCIDIDTLLLKSQILKRNISSVCICFDDYLDLSYFVCAVSLPELVGQFKELSIGIQIIIGDNQKVLQAQIIDYLVNVLPTSIYGLTLILPPSASPSFIKTYSYLTDGLYFGRDIIGEYGTSSDELNQLIHAITNTLTHEINYLSSSSFEFESSKDNVVVVGGGPSLDEHLDYLKQQADNNAAIIAAGSSIGTLLKHNIKVAAVVLLERGASVYQAIKKLNAEGFSTSNITLISSITVDPRLSSLFKETYFYHRPVSTTAFFFAGESDTSSLLISGPEAVNASVEVALKIGFKRIIMLGCDFASPSRLIYRSKDAIGNSPRDLNIPVRSNASSTIYTDELLTSTYRSLELALAVQENIEVTRIGLGVKIDNLFYDAPYPPDYPLSVCNANVLYEQLSKCSFKTRLSTSNILSRADELINSLEKLPAIFDRSLMTSSWSIKHHRSMSEVLDVSRYQICRETYLPDYVAIELLRNLIFALFASLYDSAPLSDDARSDMFDRVKLSLTKATEFCIVCLKTLKMYHKNQLPWDPNQFSGDISNI